MRSAGTDYIKLFRRFPLVVLRDEAEYQEAIQHRDWLRSRTELSRDALEYGEILDIIILDFEAKEADREMTQYNPEGEVISIAFTDDDTFEPEDNPVLIGTGYSSAPTIAITGCEGATATVSLAVKPTRKRKTS